MYLQQPEEKLKEMEEVSGKMSCELTWIRYFTSQIKKQVYFYCFNEQF